MQCWSELERGALYFASIHFSEGPAAPHHRRWQANSGFSLARAKRPRFQGADHIQVITTPT